MTDKMLQTNDTNTSAALTPRLLVAMEMSQVGWATFFVAHHFRLWWANDKAVCPSYKAIRLIVSISPCGAKYAAEPLSPYECALPRYFSQRRAGRRNPTYATSIVYADRQCVAHAGRFHVER